MTRVQRTFRSLLALLGGLLGVVLLTPAMTLTVLLLAMATATRRLARWFEPRLEDASGLVFGFDPVVGWRPKPHVEARYRAVGGDICRMETDAEGWIGAGSVEEADVVVFGDSFVSAYGVDPEDAFTELRTDLRVKAIGAPGYNMVQSLLLMRELGPRLSGKLVVWYICLENDLFDNLRPHKPERYRTPFVRQPPGGAADVEWEIVVEHLEPRPWTATSDEAPYYPMLARLCIPSAIGARTYSACAFLLREARKVLGEMGARLAVATIPNKNQLSPEGISLLKSHLTSSENVAALDPRYPDRVIGEICRGLQVPFFPGMDVLRHGDYKRNDTHWTRAGHRRAADWLFELVNAADGGGVAAPMSVGTGHEGPSPPVSGFNPSHIRR